MTSFTHKKLCLTVAAVVVYIGAFFPLTYQLNTRAVSLTPLPVIVIGWLWGMRAGMLAAVSAIPLNVLLMFVTRQPDWNIWVHRQNLAGVIGTIIIGAAAGYGGNLKRRARRDAAERKQTEEALLTVSQGVSATTGDAFFRSLAEYLAIALSSSYVIIGKLSNEKADTVQTVAALLKGTFVENFEYSLQNTPCENVIAQKLRCFPRDVRSHFPNNRMLAELDVESFIGTPLFDSAGKAVGVISVMDGKPMENTRTAEAVLRIFAVRASVELERKWVSDSLELLKKGVEALPMGITVVDTQGKIVYVNPAEAAVHGRHVEDLMGRDARVLAPQESWSPMPFEQLHAMGDWKRESVNIRANGERFPVQLTSIAVRNTGGAPVGIITACEDVTERRRAEEALRASESSYRTLAENLPGIVYRVYLSENNRMQIFNNMLEPMTGYSAEELTSGAVCSIDPLIMPDDREIVIETVKNAVETGEPFKVEYRVRHKSGEIRNFHERGRPVRGPDERPTHIDGVILDITERKRAEEKLIQRQEALRSVYRMATTLGSSFKAVCDDVVSNLSRLLGVSHVFILRREQGKVKVISGAGHGDFIIDAVTCPETCPCVSVYREKKTVQYRGPLREICPDHPFAAAGLENIACIPIMDSGGVVIGAINIIGWRENDFTEDATHLVEIFARYIAFVSEREEMERKLRNAQKMEVIGKLAGGVAHEVRNPLNAIMALSDALAKDLGRNPEYEPFLAHIRIQVERLSALMRDLLDLGKPVAQSHVQRIFLAEACSMAVDIWKQCGRKRTHAVEIVRPSGATVQVIADAKKLHQVFVNLLDNAAQHSPEGGGIRLIIHEPEDGMCRIRVVDRGSGMPQDMLARLFEPFFSTRSGGTGLGMSIVKHIVEAHGGTVTIANNDPPPGCTVEISLPLAEGEQS